MSWINILRYIQILITNGADADVRDGNYDEEQVFEIVNR